MEVKSATSTLCYVCKLDSNEKRVNCAFCPNWAHTKCAHLSGIKTDNISLISWHCNTCFIELTGMKKLKSDVEGFKRELQKMTSRADQMIENVNEKMMQLEVIGRRVNEKVHEKITKLEDVGNMVSHAVGDVLANSANSSPAPQQEGDGGSWVSIVKRKRSSKKNLLIVRPTEGDCNTIAKHDLSQALSGTQINDTKFKEDKIVMNFENENLRNEAAQKLESVQNVSTKPVKKLKPKLTLCNVHKEEEKDDIVNTIIARNEYLQTISNISSKIEIIFCKPAAGGTVHYILRCDPEVREFIRKNDDKVKLEWGIYKVYDRYHALICHHCQRYGHIQENCTSKTNNEEPYCFKCAGRHKSKECNSTEKKCINCVRYRKQNVDHSANDHCCDVLASEIERLRNMTDHGY